MRCYLLTLPLLFLSSAAVHAQVATTTVTVDFADGKHEVKEGLTNDQATDLFMDFLLSDQDGRFQVSDGAKVMMEARKTGEELQVTAAGRTDTGTVKNALGNFEEARAAGQLGTCRSNLKNIGTALDMWASDHQGLYPTSLGQLVPEYLLRPLSCPAAKDADSYSSTYRKSSGSDHFLVRCTGDHSGAALGQGLPAYDSNKGFITDEAELP